MEIKENDLVAKARGRSHIYGLLSRVYSREPNKDFLEALRNPTFLEALMELDIELGQDFKNAHLDGLVDELSIEYTRLFIGPGRHIYPYESQYRRDKEGASIDILQGFHPIAQIRDLSS
ncbi:MAG: molecular chaperone TorD family protein [Desulfatiglandales bacterium]